MCGPGQPPGGWAGGFASAADALAQASAALAFVARADAASLPTAVQAELLRDLERAESAQTAARASVLGVFAGQLGFEDDGHRGARSWLMWQTRVTRGAAGGAIGWAKRLPAHPLVDAALAAGRVSTSWAKQVCDWSGKLPADRRGDADQILLAAVAGGAGLAEEMFRRAAPPDRDDGDSSDGDGSGDDGGAGGPGDPGGGAGDPGAGASGGPGGGDDGGSVTGRCSWTCISAGRGICWGT